MSISEKQIKLVESILYSGDYENLTEVQKYITDLIAFRDSQNDK